MNPPHAHRIRRPVIAGSWYPGNEATLARTVDDYLSAAEQPPVPGRLVGLIAPHAGYAYSGPTAAYAYRQLQGKQMDTVILLGPSHRAWVGNYAVSVEEAYQTPLGLVPLDRELITGLQARLRLDSVQRDAEHSLEIQLPFLQRQLGAFHLVPILMNAEDPAAARRLAGVLAETIRERPQGAERTLLVASSDLHHVENYDEVVRRDRAVVAAIAAYDLAALTPLLMAPTCSVCGRMPILTVLEAACTLGADSVQVLQQTNSGDVTGQRGPGQYTVGYMAAAVYQASKG